jgi:SAM-dependent methyltransferase
MPLRILQFSYLAMMNIDDKLRRDIIQWDVKNWGKALQYWETRVDWSKVENCLEIGGREGGLSLWLALKGKKVICSDREKTKETAEKLHTQYKVTDRITYQDIDATNIPYEGFFDLIVFKSIVGGIGRGYNKEIQAEVFRQAYKALKPGGVLLFAENLKASAFHRFFRKRFTKWSVYWRYPTLDEMNEFLKDFSSTELHTAGILGTFGRSESQKDLLAGIDNALLDSLTPESWKYFVIGVAKK